MNDSKANPIDPRIARVLEAAGIPLPLQVAIPGELAEKLKGEASRKKIAPDQLAIEIVSKYLSKRRM